MGSTSPHWSRTSPQGGRRGALRHGAFVPRSEPGLGRDGAGLQRDPVHQAADRRLWTQRLPGGLAAYLGEKWHSWSDVTPPDDFLCATLTLYWVTQTITSSMRDYWDNRWYPVDPKYVGTPTAFGVFAHQTVPRASRRARIWSACTTSSAGQSFPAAGTSPQLRNRRDRRDLTAFFRDLSSGHRTVG